MPKDVYIGESGLAKKVKQIYIGIDDVARKIKKGYVGVDGVARLFFQGNGAYYGKFAVLRGGINYYDPETGVQIASVGSGMTYRFKGASIAPGRLFVSTASNNRVVREYNSETGALIHNGKLPEGESSIYNSIGGTLDGKLYVGAQASYEQLRRIDPETFAVIEYAGFGNGHRDHLEPLGGANGTLIVYYFYNDSDGSQYDSAAIQRYDTITGARLASQRASDNDDWYADEAEYGIANARLSIPGGYFSGPLDDYWEYDPATFLQIREIVSGSFKDYKPTIIR